MSDFFWKFPNVNAAWLIVGLSVSANVAFATDRSLMSMETIRNTPSRDDILRLIDDDSARALFSKFKFVKVEERGAIDSSTVSSWCEVSEFDLGKLFELKFFKPVMRDDPIVHPVRFDDYFDVYGVRSIGYMQFGMGFSKKKNCLSLYIVDTQ